MAKENGKSQPKPDTIETVRFVPLGELKSAVRQIVSVPIAEIRKRPARRKTTKQEPKRKADPSD